MSKGLKIASILVILIFAGMYLVGLDYNLMDYDEGAVYLYPRMLYNFGLKPYGDFTYTQPPLLFVGGGGILDSRMMTVLSVFILGVGVYVLGRAFGCGYYAVIFTLSCPLIMHFGRLATGDIPAIMMFSISLILFIYDLKGGFNLLLYGGFVALAILIKVQMIIPLMVVFALMMLRGEFVYSISGVFACGSIVGVAFMYPGMLDDTIFGNSGGYNFTRAVSYLANSMVQFTFKGAFLLIFAIYGGVISLKRYKERKYMILFAIVGSAIITASTYSWLNYRHFMYLIPILAIFAGIGLKSFKSVPFGIVVVLMSLFIPLDQWHSSMMYDNATRDIVGQIQNYTITGDMIYTDQPMLAYLANRSMPNTAHMWNGIGRLRGMTADDVIGDIKVNNPKMILIVTSTPDSMEPPRIQSTFGDEGADKIIQFLDSNYNFKEYARRDYQMVRIWKSTDGKVFG